MQPIVLQNAWVYLAPVLSGILLGISQPLVIDAFRPSPIDSTGLSGLLVLIAYVPVFLVTQNASVKKSFFFGFTTAFVQYVITIYWLVIAIHVFGGVHVGFSIVVLCLTCAAIACYIGSAFAVAQYLHRRLHWSFLAIAPAAICSIEYLRNFGFFGGFPWGVSGYSLATVPILLQGASVVGIYGLVFFVVLVNAAVASLINGAVFRWRALPRLIVAAGVATLFLLGYGAWRLLDYDAAKLKSVKVALLQGNIEQGIKNQASLYSDAILEKYRRLQHEAASKQVDVAIWPEAAFPLRVPNAAQRMIDLGDKTPATLVGAVAFESKSSGNTDRYELVHFNRALLLGPNFEIKGRFDKSHLVPFGEYVPWPFEVIVDRIVPGLGAFAQGNDFNPQTIGVANGEKLPIGVTICYEGVFPEISRTFVKNGASLLVNLTNDAWYGVSSAPYQHLRMYSVRAVETGRSYARATNTGVSAIIDPRGYVHGATPLYEDAVVVEQVPIGSEKTLYVILGDVIAYLSLVFVLIAWIIGLVGKNVLIRKRASVEWALGLMGFGLALWSHWHFAEQKLNLIEAASTKDTFVTGFGLLVGSAALSGQPWGRKALLWAGGLAAAMCTLIAYVDGPIYLLGSLIAFTVFVCAWRRPFAYQTMIGARNK